MNGMNDILFFCLKCIQCNFVIDIIFIFVATNSYITQRKDGMCLNHQQKLKN